MKKLMIALMAIVAMTLMSSCGNSNLSDDPKEMVSQLGENLKAGDGNKFVTMLGDVKTKAVSFLKDNPGKAKEYLQAAQKFLVDNKDKVAEVIGKISDSELAKKAQSLVSDMSSQDVGKLLENIPGL
ncbi:MAG: hypothetical protein J6V97_00380 [Prevotella sp.]|jgi:hypothetical protein|nr:hypothetical protein [Prevotella sp.]